MQDPVSSPAVEAAEPPKSNRAALVIVFLVVVVDLLGFAMVLPLLPVFAGEYVGVLLEDGPLVGVIVGSLLSSFSLMQFIFMPIWGRVSDRIGRRPVLLASLAGSAAFYGLFGAAMALPTTSALLALVLLFIARIGGGIVGATIGTAQAVIADSTPPEKRKHGMALIGAAFGIAFTFGPLLGFLTFFLPDIRGIIGFAAAGLSIVALLLAIRKLPETRKTEAARDRKWFGWSGIKKALTSSAIAPVVLLFFLTIFGFGALESTLSLMLEDLGFSKKDSFLIFAYIGFVLLVAQGFLYRRLARRLSEVAFVAMGIPILALGVGSLGAVTYCAAEAIGNEFMLLGLLVLGLTAAPIGAAFLQPSAQALISRRTSAEEQGEILGVNQSASALARILGPLTGVFLYKLTTTHVWPYVLAAGLLLLMLPLIPRIRRG